MTTTTLTAWQIAALESSVDHNCALNSELRNVLLTLLQNANAITITTGPVRPVQYDAKR